MPVADPQPCALGHQGTVHQCWPTVPQAQGTGACLPVAGRAGASVTDQLRRVLLPEVRRRQRVDRVQSAGREHVLVNYAIILGAHAEIETQRLAPAAGGGKLCS